MHRNSRAALACHRRPDESSPRVCGTGAKGTGVERRPQRAAFTAICSHHNGRIIPDADVIGR
jgi:hypothetical protein